MIKHNKRAMWRLWLCLAAASCLGQLATGQQAGERASSFEDTTIRAAANRTSSAASAPARRQQDDQSSVATTTTTTIASKLELSTPPAVGHRSTVLSAAPPTTTTLAPPATLLPQTATSQQQQQAAKNAPVLRPSLEEVASELSRKYLNLERHKGAAPGQRASGSALAAAVSEAAELQLESEARVGAEQEIVAPERQLARNSSSLAAGVLGAQQRQDGLVASSQKPPLSEEESPRTRTARPGDAASARANDTTSARGGTANGPLMGAGAARTSRANQYSAARRRKMRAGQRHLAHLQHPGHSSEDADELLQCQEYLQLHSTAHAAAPLETGGRLAALSTLSASQMLPCACESGWHFAAAVDSSVSTARVWLNCDNVQLIGSQLFTPHFEQAAPNGNHSSLDGGGAKPSRRPHAAEEAAPDGDWHTSAMFQFSQRDADLQVLFSQKFHYLRLSSLKSIDLSRNRLRAIKMDAFHGLEHKLEYLNLADNLLGDSRAMFASDAAEARASGAPPPPLNQAREAHQNGEKSIFFTDELNRLRALKWLSLRANQINQLSANIFIKQTSSSSATNSHMMTAAGISLQQAASATSSELTYLDLSHNLLKAIPSEAIHQLNKLQWLRLDSNKITRLDQASKFPPNLRQLDLSDNLIDTIRHSDLVDLVHLIELDLSNNQLQHLDQLAFVSASALAQSPPASPNTLASGANVAPSQEVEGFNAGASQEGPQLIDSIGQQSGPVASNHQQAAQQRKRRQTSDAGEAEAEAEAEAEVLDALESSMEGSEHENDLDAVESVFSAFAERLGRNNQAVAAGAEELSLPARATSQFNATLRLNLSQNLFESIPGDSLLKFTNLQVLDLSHNRIRQLDSNYLCSIYNLVDNLQHLDLSGNLLSLGQQQQQQGEGASQQVHLNKLFGCLQKLEKLILSTNRLLSVAQNGSGSSKSQELEGVESSAQPAADDLQVAATNHEEDFAETPAGPSSRAGRLAIKLGDEFGGRTLHTLDLSDNRLDAFPIIEQVAQQQQQQQQQPIVLVLQNSTASPELVAANQARLSKWMSARRGLEVLNLNYNNIDRVDGHDLEHLYNVRQLHLSFNKLTSLPARLMRRFASLEELSLAGNRISALEPLNELLARSMRSLRTLNLANNRLVDWPRAAPAPGGHNQAPSSAASASSPNAAAAAAAGGGELSMLDFVLEELNLEGNLLTSANVSALFDQLIHMRSLKTLNLNYNLLNRVRSEWFKFANRNLQRLLLTGNKINTIDPGAFAANQANELLALGLDFNLLKELRRKTFDSLPNLRELNLNHNLIHTINSETFHQLNALQVLRLSHNKLTSWKCEYFSHLCNSISGNINVDLATLINNEPSASALASLNSQQQANINALSSLVELDLSYNSLSQLRANSISVHTKLVKLNLAHNKLSFIPHDLFKATTSAAAAGPSPAAGGAGSERQLHLISSLKYLNLAFNRIQTVDNINFKPLRHLRALDLSFNELQTLGVDVVNLSAHEQAAGSQQQQQQQQQRRLIVSSNLTSLLADPGEMAPDAGWRPANQSARAARSLYSSGAAWPALSKLRALNLAHNSLSMINQSLLAELSPFVALNLNLSHNYLDSDSLPAGFFAKISTSGPAAAGGGGGGGASQGPLSGGAPKQRAQAGGADAQAPPQTQTYDLVFTLKLESLDLSFNRLADWPGALLDNHYSSMESCNLAHNRLQTLPQNSNAMVQLKSLDLEFNPLSRESSELLLFEQRSARHLNLAATRLYAIQQATADGDQYSRSLHHHQQSLKSRLVNQTSQLDLIRSISKPLEAPYLRHLNLSSNQLVWLAANVFDKLHSLQTLDLSNNQLTRLHLLSNQLNRVAPTLEFLNVGANLFTSVDATDFQQLTRLRHLDLANLLSLQKLNCRFLSKLTTLTHLRMFNYPQLRHNLNNLLASLRHNSDLPERYKQKIRAELIMSTIGSHCFQADGALPLARGGDTNEPMPNQPATKSWFKIKLLELELFNNFGWRAGVSGNQPISDSFTLRDELQQLLSPSTQKVSLFGLNVTSISELGLLGVASGELELQISYTSLAQLPLRQILGSLAKRTRLRLDLRHNNIQSIDVDALQWLDELQQVNLAAPQPSGDGQPPAAAAALRLASNPFRCDCQTRPLWLWLNQRWDTSEPAGLGGEDQLEAATTTTTTTASASNYWLKFHTISQANDLKCFYPLKLRGKLAQHVHYNDLVCKGQAAGLSSSAGSSGRQSRKRANETTRTSDYSYYMTSTGGEQLQGDSEDSDLEEDYATGEAASSGGEGPATGQQVSLVRVTRFNRYPSTLASNASLYFLANFPAVPFAPDARNSQVDGQWDSTGDFGGAQDGGEPSRRPGAIGKRDQHSVPTAPAGDSGQQQQHQVNTKYTKHRPNTLQKHAHYNTMTNLQSASFGRGNNGAAQASAATSASTAANALNQQRSSMLTDSDIMILTVASVAMTIMSLIIISVCLFKYKLDHNDQEHILSTHSKLVLSQALFTSKAAATAATAAGGGGKPATSGGGGGSSGSSKRSKGSRRTNGRKSGEKSPESSPDSTEAKRLEISRLSGSAVMKASQLRPAHYQIRAAPIGLAPVNPAGVLLAPAAQNFLMRSPTIRRMHGLANNASDWFKYTLRAYPASTTGARRRRLFIQNNAVCGSSQLSTPKLATRYHQNQLQQRQEQYLTSSLLHAGCPLHAFECLEALVSSERVDAAITVNCIYCATLAAAMQQTKAHARQQQRLAARAQMAGASGGGGPLQRPLNAATKSASSTAQAERAETASKLMNDSGEQSGDADEAEAQAARAVGNEQQAAGNLTFQATIEQHGGFMPPKMIQALARRLDERHNGAADCARRPQLSGSFYSRDQQSRSLRTFGQGAPLAATMAAGAQSSSSALASDLQLAGGDQSVGELRSQIPTIGVAGRFAYQSDSRLDSPYGRRATIGDDDDDDGQSSRARGGGAATPTSTVATGREDIFILVRDTPTLSGATTAAGQSEISGSGGGGAGDSRRHSQTTERSQCASSDDGELRRLGRRMRDAAAVSASLTNDEVNSTVMQDECSRTSSPIAYGFMRASPSATLSSTNTTAAAAAAPTQGHYALSGRSPDLLDEQAQQGERARTSGRGGASHGSFLSGAGDLRKHLAAAYNLKAAAAAAAQDEHLLDSNNNNAAGETLNYNAQPQAGHKHYQRYSVPAQRPPQDAGWRLKRATDCNEAAAAAAAPDDEEPLVVSRL